MSEVKAEYQTPSGIVIQVRQGDLTLEEADAIVNAANSQLAHGGGVAGAIVRRGGFAIQEESEKWIRTHGSVPTGQVALTSGGQLHCKYVIHAVGPVWHGGASNEDELLRSAVWNSLMKAHELGLRSTAIPAISSGIFGFPKDRCAAILVHTAVDFCEQYPQSSLREIRFTNFDQPTVNIIANALNQRIA